MEIVGVRITTIVEDNVANRCDGCLEVIDGTPWRVNVLDIVAPERAADWTDQPAINPGPFQFHSDQAHVRQLDGRPRATCSAARARSARSCDRSPSRPPTAAPSAGACATASTATTTSSSPPDRAPRDAAGSHRDAVDDAARRSVSCACVGRPTAIPRFTQISHREVVIAACPDPPHSPESAAGCRSGPASRLLGVDPDTLRRWADEGRIEAFTTPGGHRRFDRRELERLLEARHPGVGTGPPLATLGATPDRLSRAYRRSYASAGPRRRRPERRPGRRPRGVPDRRPRPRRVARRLPRRRRTPRLARAAESRAAALTDDLARRLAAGRPQPDRVRRPVRRRPPAVPRRARRRSPAAGPSTPTGSARCSRTPRRSSTGSSIRLDRGPPGRRPDDAALAACRR